MRQLLRPTLDTVKELLNRVEHEPLTYPQNSGSVPRGYVEDAFRVPIGTGAEDFRRACEAVREWRMFHPTMTSVMPDQVPIENGRCVAVLFHAWLFWTINPCRIVDVIQQDVIQQSAGFEPSSSSRPTEPAVTARYGFAYGTLPGHIESGREEFLVEWTRSDDVVWYVINVFSRPHWWPVWLVWPVARSLQRRFRQLSGIAMKAAVQTQRETVRSSRPDSCVPTPAARPASRDDQTAWP